MKKILILVVIFFAGFLTSSLLMAESEKIYVAPAEVILDADGVFFNENGEMLRVSQIGFDEEGLYVIPQLSLINSPQMWICRMCGSDNSFWHDRCPDCNHRRQ